MARLDDQPASIDVLVTDVVMPGMSGIDLAERVIERFPAAGIVLLSGYNAETLDLDRVVRRGGDLPVQASHLGRFARRRRAVTGPARRDPTSGS